MPASVPTASRSFSKADKVRLASLILMVGFALSIFVHYWLGAYCGYRYPYSTYLMRPSDTMLIDNIVTNSMLPALSRAILGLQLEKKPLTEAKVSVENGAFAYAVS